MIAAHASPLPRCPLLRCPPLFLRAALSTPALSTLASSCYVVHSCVVQPCFIVPTCPLPRCPLSRFQRPRYRQLLWNANRKPYLSFRMVPFSMILSDFYSRSVQSVRQSKSFRFVLEANEKTNFCSELLAVFENWLSGCFACVRWIGSWSQCLVSALV